MNVEYINPIIEASITVLKQIAGVVATLGKVQLKDSPYKSDNVLIILGLAGKVKGQAIFSLSYDNAKFIASSMMGGMQINDLDEIAKSAISEMTNMIMGNASTLLYNKGISMDITPPSLVMGDNLTISPSKMKTVSIPLLVNNKNLVEIDIALEG